MILKRLQDKSANYNVSKWEKEENNRVKVLKNICEYPLMMKDGYSQPDFIIRRGTGKKSASANPGFYKRKGVGDS